MRILLTNDDGFWAEGMQALYETLAQDDHEICIVAPEGQRSATGRSITIYEPLFVSKHELKCPDIGYSVNGTPTDCVKLAVQGSIVPFNPDLIISGINDGPNLGTDVFYSGTVSAAMEGVLLGIPSLAVSLASYEFGDYYPGANFIRDLIRNKGEYLLNNTVGLLNINIPGKREQEWHGVRITKLGKAFYENTFEGRKSPFGKEYFWINGTLTQEDDEETDLTAIKEGYVTITPLHGDLTDYKKIPQLKLSFRDMEK